MPQSSDVETTVVKCGCTDETQMSLMCMFPHAQVVHPPYLGSKSSAVHMIPTGYQ